MTTFWSAKVEILRAFGSAQGGSIFCLSFGWIRKWPLHGYILNKQACKRVEFESTYSFSFFFNRHTQCKINISAKNYQIEISLTGREYTQRSPKIHKTHKKHDFSRVFTLKKWILKKLSFYLKNKNTLKKPVKSVVNLTKIASKVALLLLNNVFAFFLLTAILL